MQLCGHRGSHVYSKSKDKPQNRIYLPGYEQQILYFRKEGIKWKVGIGKSEREQSVFPCRGGSWIVLGRQSALSRGHNTKQAQQAFSLLTTAFTLKTSFGVLAMNRGPSETKHRLTEQLQTNQSLSCPADSYWPAGTGTPGICQFIRPPYGDEINTVE